MLHKIQLKQLTIGAIVLQVVCLVLTVGEAVATEPPRSPEGEPEALTPLELRSPRETVREFLRCIGSGQSRNAFVLLEGGCRRRSGEPRWTYRNGHAGLICSAVERPGDTRHAGPKKAPDDGYLACRRRAGKGPGQRRPR